ncbi:MAG: hypothetical protein K6A65_09150 [Succinivibrionaceae bacterium]|nr:hypothetical protein [Succinivibrionaceae bacterium]
MRLLMALTAALFACLAAAAQAAYPDRPVKVFCARGEGSALDQELRLLLKYLRLGLNHDFEVENVGKVDDTDLEGYLSAPADGYTLMATSSLSLAASRARGNIGFGHEDFEPLVIFARLPGEVIAVRADSPFRELEDLISQAAAAPGTLTYGTSLSPLSMLPATIMEKDRGAAFEYLDLMASPSERLDALLEGRVDVGYFPLPLGLGAWQAGRVRFLATTLPERMPSYPDLPTAMESGLPSLYINQTSLLMAPRGTPSTVIDFWAARIEGVVNRNRAFRDELREACHEDPFFLGHGETLNLLRQQDAEVSAYETYWNP